MVKEEISEADACYPIDFRH